VRRTALLLLAVMAAALVAASGVALARNYVGTDRGEKIVGTDSADTIDANGGDDVVQGLPGPDRIRGGNGKDRQYGARGNDVIFSEGASGTWSIAAEASTRLMSTPGIRWWTVKG